MNSAGIVKSKIENGIATISFFHPKSNSLPGYLLEELARKINYVSSIKDVHAIILKSEGEKTFCAGASFDELLEIDNFEKGKVFFSGFANVINAMRISEKIIITRVQGKAVGGGVGLIASSDYSLALDSASVKLSELALGIGPFVVGPAVERKIGKAAFTAMTIDYNWRQAKWAKENGLFVDIFRSIGDLDNAVRDLSEKLASSSLEALKNLKHIFWQGTENWKSLLDERAELSGRLVLSEFTKNYINKFKGNR